MKQVRILAALQLAALLATVCAQPVSCQGKITVDPNANRPVAEPSKPKVDERLLQPVTISATYKTVSVIVAELAKSAGIRLLCGSSPADRETRSRKLHVYARDVPLNQLMDSIARVTGFKWKITEGKNGPTYRLITDLKTIADAKALLEKQRLKWQADQVEVRKKAVAEFIKIPDFNEAQTEELRHTNPYLYFMATTPWTRGVMALLRDCTELRQALESGTRLTIRLSELPKPVLEGLVGAAVATDKQFGHSDAPDVSSGFWANRLRDPEKVSVYVKPQKDSPSAHFGLRSIGSVGIACEQGGSLSTDLCDPNSRAVQLSFQGLLTQLELGHHLDVYYDALVQAADQEYLARLDWGEPMPEHQDLPELKRTVKVNLAAEWFEDTLKQLAEDTGMAVVCDDWERIRGVSIAEKEVPLATILDSVSSRLGRVWNLRGPVIEMRDRLWVQKLGYVVPEHIAPALIARLDRSGYIDLADLALLANLNGNQIMNLDREDRLRDLRPWLSPNLNVAIGTIWAPLSDTERRALLDGQEMKLSVLRDRCPEAIEKFQACRPFTKLGKDTTFRITRSPYTEGRGYTYELILSDPSWAKEETIVFITPYETKKPPAGR